MRLVPWCLVVWCLSVGLVAVPTASSAQAPQPLDAALARARAAARMVPGELPHSLHYLTFLSDTVRLSKFVQGASDTKVGAVLTVFQIRYAHGWIMVDAGMDRDVEPSKLFQQARYDQVQRALQDANLVVVTHEHHDHVAGVLRAAAPERVVPKTVLTRAQVQTLIERPDLPIIRMTPEAAAGYIVIDYDLVAPLAPGVALIKAPGHSPGSQMIYVRLASGKEVLFIGDIVWNMAGLDGPRQKPETLDGRELGEDRVALQQQMEWLRDLMARKAIELIPCHDKEWLAGLERRGILRATLDLTGR